MRDIDAYTQEYLKNSFEDYQVKYRKHNILKIIQEKKPKTILEIGCGTEPLFLDIDMNEVSLYTVVEPSKVFFEHAKDVSMGQKKIQVVNDFFENFNNQDSLKYDLIVCSGLLHELANPETILEHAKIFMNSHSIFYANVPNAKSFHRLLALEMGMIDSIYQMSERNIQLQQSSVYDKDSLNQLLIQNGFLVIEDGSYFVKPFDHKHMEWLVEKMGESVLEGLDKMIEYMPDLGSEIFAICKL
ncbi:MAG: methyltransferase domain-containing protein [Eubacteriales bacterium]|nr:methyltransferase domain-containing protein [Eubacteriales bacterium]